MSFLLTLTFIPVLQQQCCISHLLKARSTFQPFLNVFFNDIYKFSQNNHQTRNFRSVYFIGKTLKIIFILMCKNVLCHWTNVTGFTEANTETTWSSILSFPQDVITISSQTKLPFTDTITPWSICCITAKTLGGKNFTVIRYLKTVFWDKKVHCSTATLLSEETVFLSWNSELLA